MNVDVISQICIFNDYPIYRFLLTKYRDKFNKIILYPSRHHGVIDLEEFLKGNFRETWVEPVPIDFGVEDWRQAETDPCLKQSDAEWIWFTEQDFFVKDWDKFFKDIEKAMETADMIGLWNPTHFPYIHPSCLFIKREMLNKTRKDFKAHPEINGADHFSMITIDVQQMGGKIATLQELGYDCEVTPNADAFHLGGLTYPYQNWKGDGTDHFGVQSLEAFAVYNYWSRQVPGESNLLYLQLSETIEKRLKELLPDFDPHTSEWRKYFDVQA